MPPPGSPKGLRDGMPRMAGQREASADGRCGDALILGEFGGLRAPRSGERGVGRVEATAKSRYKSGRTGRSTIHISSSYLVSAFTPFDRSDEGYLSESKADKKRNTTCVVAPMSDFWRKRPLRPFWQIATPRLLCGSGRCGACRTRRRGAPVVRRACFQRYRQCAPGNRARNCRSALARPW